MKKTHCSHQAAQRNAFDIWRLNKVKYDISQAIFLSKRNLTSSENWPDISIPFSPLSDLLPFERERQGCHLCQWLVVSSTRELYLLIGHHLSPWTRWAGYGMGNVITEMAKCGLREVVGATGQLAP